MRASHDAYMRAPWTGGSRAPARCDGGAGFCQPTVRVLVVDDQLAFHDVADELIDATVGFERIGGRAVASKASSRPSRLYLVLMDVRMPGIGGVEAARQIASRGLPAIVVLVTAGQWPSESAESWRRSGACPQREALRSLAQAPLGRLSSSNLLVSLVVAVQGECQSVDVDAAVARSAAAGPARKERLQEQHGLRECQAAAGEKGSAARA